MPSKKDINDARKAAFDFLKDETPQFIKHKTDNIYESFGLQDRFEELDEKYKTLSKIYDDYDRKTEVIMVLMQESETFDEFLIMLIRYLHNNAGNYFASLSKDQLEKELNEIRQNFKK